MLDNSTYSNFSNEAVALDMDIAPNSIVFDSDNNASINLLEHPSSKNEAILFVNGDIKFMVSRLLHYIDTIWKGEEVTRCSLAFRSKDTNEKTVVEIDFHYKANSVKSMVLKISGGTITIHPSFFELASTFGSS